MSKRERASPMTLGRQINYKKQKSEEYVNAQKTSDIFYKANASTGIDSH